MNFSTNIATTTIAAKATIVAIVANRRNETSLTKENSMQKLHGNSSQNDKCSPAHLFFSLFEVDDHRLFLKLRFFIIIKCGLI